RRRAIPISMDSRGCPCFVCWNTATTQTRSGFENPQVKLDDLHGVLQIWSILSSFKVRPKQGGQTMNSVAKLSQELSHVAGRFRQARLGIGLAACWLTGGM